jgi:iron only hydrogenase large subunit-like protein
VNYLSPIFTERHECQDCYKCVRHCPVKAIKVEGGCASVITEMCVYCGQCVEVCPNNAKRVRDDLAMARRLIASGKRIIVSLAPSFVAEFTGVRPGQLIAAIKKLGFADVSETALGAQQVSAHVRAKLQETPPHIYLSSACPTIVSYVQKYHPQLAPALTGFLTPLLTHATMLRRQYGNDIAVAFIGPCISKKLEADAHPDLVDVALTFDDLHRWLETEQIDPATLVEDVAKDRFIPESACEGAMYPIDGGMIAGIKKNCAISDSSLMCFSGVSTIARALVDLETFTPEKSLFVELLACEGGCINGPRTRRKAQTLLKRHHVLRYTDRTADPEQRTPEFPINTSLPPAQQRDENPTEAQIREALRTVGKRSIDDELNCGGCGYDSCRQFGRALVLQKAERAMCVTYMRKLAHKKANALIQKMPSAVVIVDEALRIVEHNGAFAKMFPGKTPAAPSAGKMAPMAGKSGSSTEPTTVEGVLLGTLVPFHPLFTSILKSGADVLERDLRYRDTILHVSIFTIEKHCVVGAILQDITLPAVQREQVIGRAQEVIRKNLATVQKIAYLLGENAAESETTLNSIIDSFAPPSAIRPTDPSGDDEDDWRKLYRH